VALPKPYRLTRNDQFSKVYRLGRQAANHHLAVKVLDRAELAASPAEPSRFGITVSQKVSKQAVVRNRLKRQIRGCLQVLIPQIKPGLWIVIVVRSAAIKCDYWQFLRELEELFSELEVFNGH